jgi:uncharacterized protein (UPF0548 family)
MFFFAKPSEDFIRRFVESQRHLPFGYAEVGATKNIPASLPPAGYAVDHNRICLGKGEAVFNAAVAALRNWKMFDIGWVELCCPKAPPDAPVVAGTTVGVLVHHFGFWSLHPARIVYLIDEEEERMRRFGFAYGTLPAHGERGEERFSIEWHRDDDSVWYDLLAFSRPNAFFAKLGSSLARGLQRRFAQASLQAMARAVSGD